ncbi:uncharacterized protein BKA55DRAFT_553030 [Fusarium redolens]|uniref:Secreted protein n=1 Tax=Fusarium redolens TaxID=48865 RepID=A0A9P9KQK4_FUSRE|nr:uncharacterized protein BKA55DRAFT_553030 [Fusarium redolens]KAH7266689.1 hypothetical protein BKA55DRAFT_553030 [Fusarium redolens]
MLGHAWLIVAFFVASLERAFAFDVVAYILLTCVTRLSVGRVLLVSSVFRALELRPALVRTGRVNGMSRTIICLGVPELRARPHCHLAKCISMCPV